MSKAKLVKVEGAQSEHGAGDVFVAPIETLWYEENKDAVDYDPRVEVPIAETFLRGVKAEGILESITVREAVHPADPSRTLKIVNGRTRYRAAVLASHATMKVGIVECADGRDALRLQVMLNAHRVADEASLQVANARRMADAGFDAIAIADAFNLPVSTAVNTLKIAKKATAKVKALIDADAIPFAAAEELARRSPETQDAVADALVPVLEEAKSKGKTSRVTGGRKADAVKSKRKDGSEKVAATHSAVKALADAAEGKAPAPKAAKPSATPTVAPKDARPDAATLRQKAALTRAVAMLAKGTGTGAEAHRAFVAGVQAALFFAAGDDLSTAKLASPMTDEAKEAVKAALDAIFK